MLVIMLIKGGNKEFPAGIVEEKRKQEDLKLTYKRMIKFSKKNHNYYVFIIINLGQYKFMSFKEPLW